MLGVENGVEEEEGAALRKERHTFHLVVVAGVAFHAAEAGLFGKHVAVVHADRFHRGAARKDGLSAAAVAGEVVVNDRTREEDVVDMAEFLVDPDGSAERRRAEVFKVVLVGRDAVVHLDAAGNFGAHFLFHLFGRHGAVRAEREDDLHVFVRNAELIHLVDENRHEDFAVGDAGRIVADEGDRVAGLHDLIDGGQTDRMVERFKNVLVHVLHDFKGFGADDLQHIVGVVLKGFPAVSVSEVISCKRHVFLLCLTAAGPSEIWPQASSHEPRQL